MGKNGKSTKHRKTRQFLAGKGVCGWGGGPSLLRRGENCRTARTRPGGPWPDFMGLRGRRGVAHSITFMDRTRWCPIVAKLVNITPITMVYGRYIYNLLRFINQLIIGGCGAQPCNYPSARHSGPSVSEAILFFFMMLGLQDGGYIRVFCLRRGHCQRN